MKLPNEIIEHILMLKNVYILTCTNIDITRKNLGVYYLEYQAKIAIIKYALKNLWVGYYLPCFRIEKIQLRENPATYIDTWDTSYGDFRIGYNCEEFTIEVWKQNVIEKPVKLIFDFDNYLKCYIEVNELKTEEDIQQVINWWIEDIPEHFFEMFKEEKTKHCQKLDFEAMERWYLRYPYLEN